MGLDRRFGGAATGARSRANVPSGIFLGLVAVTAAGGVAAWFGLGNVGFDVLLFVLGGWLVSLCLHEYAHAYTAYRSGDRSVVAKGYLTLNPLKYAHPVLSIGLPVLFILLGGIGLPGGAVTIERQHIRGRLADSLISAAGPLVNVVLTIVLSLIFVLGAGGSPFGIEPGSGHPAFWSGLALLAFLQLTASVLNLAPIPGVDGANLLRPWLTGKWLRWFDLFAPYGLLLLFALLLERRVNAIFFSVVYELSALLGVSPVAVAYGFDLLQFWR